MIVLDVFCNVNRMATVTAAVLDVNPSARVQSCSYGQVPLHAVLGVEAPRTCTDVRGVSHEVRGVGGGRGEGQEGCQEACVGVINDFRKF